jgi:heptose-I-phosphate ethanolaminephosphotransferase
MMLNLKKIHLKSIFTIGLFVFYPFLVLFIFGWFVIPYAKEYLKEIIAFGLLSLVFFNCILIIPKVKIRKWLLLLFTIVLSVLIFIKISFYHHYGVKISASALFVIFETNAVEATDFLSNYVNYFTIVLLLLLLNPYLLYFVKSIRVFFQKSLQENLSFSILKIVALLLIPISLYLIHLKFQDKNIVLTSYYTYEDFLSTKKLLKKNIAQKHSKIIKVDSFNKSPQIHVVIIGESTSKWHMQLYGYSRETNPLLTEIEDELIVFKDVITPHVHTINALEKILTLTIFNDPNKKENASVVQLSNQAGYTTYWLSNQRPVGLHESTASLISGGADFKYFLSSNDYMFNIYDENILPKLDDIILEKKEKKIIFIHLIGTHSGYDNRYPESYSYFNGVRENQKFTHEKAISLTNEYDNSVRYNDFIVREIIEKIRKTNTNSYVMYFSDHGDDIFDVYNDIAGHNEYHGTSPMYEIPFIVWASESYKNNHPKFEFLKKNRFKKYNLEHFIHSFSEISDIKFNLFQPTNSIFNSHFKETKRIIKNGEDYDAR